MSKSRKGESEKYLTVFQHVCRGRKAVYVSWEGLLKVLVTTHPEWAELQIPKSLCHDS